MRVGVVGATVVVGREMLRVLEERAFPVDELRVYASARSEGRKLEFAGREVTCETLRAGGAIRLMMLSTWWRRTTSKTS